MRILYAIAALTLSLVCLTACGNRSQPAESNASLSSTVVGDRTFTLEDEPETSAEETVAREFLYTITAEFDQKYEIVADTEPHTISIENEKAGFAEGLYTKTLIIHQIDTLEESEYAVPSSPLYYHSLERLIGEYALTDYHIVRVRFTKALSDRANELGPQWGDGTYERSFLVGSTETGESYRIYDFGIMYEWDNAG